MPTQPKKRFDGFGIRVTHFALVIVAASCVIVSQLWRLQVVEGHYYQSKARDERIHYQRLNAPRGMIYGNDETVVLADNRPSCDLVMVRAGSESPEVVCKRLEELVHIDSAALIAEVARYESQPFKQILVKKDVSKADLLRVEEHSFDLPGVFPVVHPQRRYLHGQTAGQILGYLNEVGLEELARYSVVIRNVVKEGDSYSAGEVLGRQLCIANTANEAAKIACAGNVKEWSEDGTTSTYFSEDMKYCLEVTARQWLPEYRMGDLIGRRGIESQYEPLMRGQDGQMQVSVYNSDRRPQLRTDAYGVPYVATDKYGRTLDEETEYRKEPLPGDAIFLTLDMDLQAMAEHLLEGEQGAIVVLQAETGAVLAMASSPGFDPNVFVTPDPNGMRTDILTSKPSRLMNRCIEEAFPPGSVFKILVAMAGLETGAIDENTSFFCGGRYVGQGFSKRCHTSHGSVSLKGAIARSCDVYFYNVGNRIGVERLHDWAQKFQFGRTTGIDLPSEISGVVPNKAWKDEFFKDRLPPEDRKWFPPETLDFAIGQGFLNTTPLQCAILVASVVNGGRVVRPYLNQAIKPMVSEPVVSERTVAAVRGGTIECVAAVNGTGRRARVDGLVMLGKTGTAQVVSQKWNAGLTDEQIPYQRRDHAWFVCGVMDPDLPVAMCVLVEHGLHGSTGAAPLAKELVEFIYSDKLAGDLVAQAEGKAP